MYFLILFALPAVTGEYYGITVYGDVLKDRDFFTKTYPWIIDIIGGDITVDYHLLGSGRYSVPQMCALAQLSSNTYLQAEFLKCEASGTRSEICLCNSGISRKLFRKCVQSSGSKAGEAALRYNQLGIESSPIIELGHKSYAFGKSNEDYLKSLCTIFGDNKPRGCLKWNCRSNSTAFVESKALAYFNCNRNYIERITPDTSTTTEITTETEADYTTTTTTYWYNKDQEEEDAEY